MVPESQAYSWKLIPPRKTALKDFRIGFILDDPLCPVSSEIKPVMQSALKKFANAGVHLEEGWPENIHPEEQFLNYSYLLNAYISGSATEPEIEKLRTEVRQGDKSTENIRAMAYTNRYKYFREQDSKRMKAREDWQEFFRHYDAFIMPVAFVPAFPHINKPWKLHNPDPDSKRYLQTPEGQRDYDDIIFWISFATLTGLPATVFPAGISGTGLPVGLQVIGPYLEDATPISLAGKLSELTGGIRHPAGY